MSSVTGTYELSDGVPDSGTVTLRPAIVATDLTPTPRIITQGPVTGVLDDLGTVTLDVLASDDDGWMLEDGAPMPYLVTERLRSGYRGYAVVLMGPGPHDLAALQPLESVDVAPYPVPGPVGPQGETGPEGPQGPTGAAAGSVLDYGADPTGVALCDQAFADALADNAVVRVPIGVFKISQPITMVSGKSLIGEAGAKDNQDTTPVTKIVQSNNAAQIITGSAVRGVVLENLFLQASDALTHTADGIAFAKGTHGATNYVTITNVHVSNVGRDGFSMENLIVSTWTGAVAVNCGRHGINLYGQESGAAGTSVVLNSCYANTCGEKTGVGVGIRIRKMTYVSLNGCAAEGCAYPNYEITRCQGVVLNGCGSEVATNDSFKIADTCLGVTLVGCWSYMNNRYAFAVESSDNVILIGCVEMDPTAGAVHSFRFDDASNVTLIAPTYYSPLDLGLKTLVLNAGSQGLSAHWAYFSEGVTSDGDGTFAGLAVAGDGTVDGTLTVGPTVIGPSINLPGLLRINSPDTAMAIVDRNATADAAKLELHTNGVTDWELGTYAGSSNIRLLNTALGYAALTVSRASNEITLTRALTLADPVPTLAGHAASKQYADARWTRWTGTQAQYDAIPSKDPNTLYVIT